MKAKLIFVFSLFFFVQTAMAAAPSGTVTMDLSPAVEKTSQNLKLWVPYPMSDEHQTITDMKITGNYSESGIYRDPASEAIYFSAVWENISVKPVAQMSFILARKTVEIPA